MGSNNHAARYLLTWHDHLYWSKGKHQIEAGVWLQCVEAGVLREKNEFLVKLL